MKDEFTDKEWKRKLPMPIGVYVCVAIVLIRFGIVNFIGYISVFSNADGEAYLPIVVISLALSAFTAGAAIWAFTGQNEGRIALLILLPLNVFWLILLVLPSLTNDEKTDNEAAVMTIIQQVIISLFVIGIEWYLMSKPVVEYYKQDD